MKVCLGNGVEFDFFQIEQFREAQQLAATANTDLYSWKTTGHSNWLEKGLSVVDVLGIVVLSKGLPHSIPLPDDSMK